jgi:hypothetical protein
MSVAIHQTRSIACLTARQFCHRKSAQMGVVKSRFGFRRSADSGATGFQVRLILQRSITASVGTRFMISPPTSQPILISAEARMLFVVAGPIALLVDSFFRRAQ